MDENPYDILGVARDASLDEVKKAYRKKARENHPDLNPDDPAAEERMNKVNEAYDRITNPEKYAASDARRRGYGAPYTPGHNGYGSPTGSPYGTSGQGGHSQQGPQGGYRPPEGNHYTWTTVNFEDLFGGNWASTAGSIHPEENASDSPEVKQAIFSINSSNWKQAIDILQKIPSTGRNARWYYLFALANNGAGNTVAANDNIRRARQLDPNNSDYVHAQQHFVRGARQYETTGQGQGFTSFGIDPSWLCCCICLAPTCTSYLSRLCLYGGLGA